MTKCHCNPAVRLLRRGEEERRGEPRIHGRRVYDEAVREAGGAVAVNGGEKTATNHI